MEDCGGGDAGGDDAGGVGEVVVTFGSSGDDAGGVGEVVVTSFGGDKADDNAGGDDVCGVGELVVTFGGGGGGGNGGMLVFDKLFVPDGFLLSFAKKCEANILFFCSS